MDIYLPIAEMSADLFLLLGLGGAVGFLSGVFGVGGGFLLTPLLILIGIPPPVAVGTQAPQILASSFSGMLAHMRRGNVDVRMGVVLVAGGLLGSVLGVWLFGLLRRLGQIDLSIALCLRPAPRHRRGADAGRIGAGLAARAHAARQASRSGTAISGCTACRSRCASSARASTSARWCRSASASWPASWSPSWASAAASSWCRR